MTAPCMIVSARKYTLVDITQCWHLLNDKTDQVATKQCNAQLFLMVNSRSSHNKLQTWGCPSPSEFTWNIDFSFDFWHSALQFLSESCEFEDTIWCVHLGKNKVFKTRTNKKTLWNISLGAHCSPGVVGPPAHQPFLSLKNSITELPKERERRRNKWKP